VLANEVAGIVIETGQPINGGALSVAYRVTKPGHGFPLGKVIVKSGPGDRRDVLAVQEIEWIADDPALMETREKTIEMRFDQNAQRFFLHVSDELEIEENEAPQYFFGLARTIFHDLLNKRAETQRA
jgi:hypothetical protein